VGQIKPPKWAKASCQNHPFAYLTILPPKVLWPQIGSMKYAEYVKRVFWRAEVEKYGYQEAYKRANQYSGKNASRYLSKALEPDSNTTLPTLSVEWLVNRCTITTHEQLCSHLNKECTHHD
jgi:hypothetical protein